jgi:hypothetical protein
MLAHHPKTGEPIRIITSNSSTWKSAKTIAWLTGLESTEYKWNRYDIGASNIETWFKLNSLNIDVDVCCLLGDISTCIEWLRSGNAASCKIVGAPKTLLETLGYNTLAELGITNMICIDEALDLYPFLERSWDKTESDAKLVLSLILQYGMAFPIIDGPHMSIANSLGLKTLTTLEPPANLYYVTQYYNPANTKRAKEIDKCLKMNVECKYIDKIILLNESSLKLPIESNKIKQYNIGSRLSFYDVFQWIYKDAPEDALICIANSDIHLDDSWRTLWSINMESTFFALLRWDVQEDGSSPKLFGPRADSQDTWVVSAKAVKDRKWDWDALKFPFGQGGCDNAITIEMLKQKFLVINPCMSLITHHVHSSKYRTYDPANIVKKPTFMYVNPSGLHDLEPIVNIGATVAKTLTLDSLSLVPKGTLTESQSTTLLTMLSKKKGDLLFSEFKFPIYEFNNVFQLSTGLLRSYSSIILGKSEENSKAWSKEEIGVASASVSIDVGLVAPCPDEIANSPVRYLLEYMGKILVLRDLHRDGEWLGVKNAEITDALKIFSWDQQTIPVVIRSPMFQTWCKKAYAWIPNDGNKQRVTSLEVSALRRALTNWISEPSKKTIVIYVDNSVIDNACVEMFEKLLNGLYEIKCIYPSTSVSSAINMLYGAYGVIVYGGKNNIEHWGTIWALPIGARVWEIQAEIEPALDLYSVANVCGLDHNFHIIPRLKPTLSTITAMVNTIVNSMTDSKSQIQMYMPSRDTKGFFSHAGDSFREMAELWAEKDYVNINYVSGLTQVWLHEIGHTLLYDRPTLDWLKQAPSKEQAWKKAFFGNPAPIGNNSSPWSFWPRRPRLLETLVEKGVGTSVQRPLSLVFYGRSENKVQLDHRSKEDWAPVCDEFVHIIGEKPYPYTQHEYLIRLSNAKWGLCLAGYGKKCHREIECMALGCVPIITSSVDIVNYINPPVEGLHYFRANTPKDVEAILNIPHEKWVKSSNACRDWWKKNASADGLWLLTTT